MTDPKHTPEPWFVGHTTGFVEISSIDYARAATCVNFLAGLNPAAVPLMVQALEIASRGGCKRFCEQEGLHPECAPCQARRALAALRGEVATDAD